MCKCYLKKLKNKLKTFKKNMRKKEELIMILFDILELVESSESNSLKV